MTRQIIDVRTPGEFAGGHAPGSLNIPLDQLEARLGDLDKGRPVILCCATGGRSGMATRFLQSLGYVATNAGPWQAVRS
ncbi:MAG TPA: rhodanese-like domain-containing protein [Holophagaceae bacterium]|nr:rhodanese-like domain-containing protein [Holophagaceae bacterium]